MNANSLEYKREYQRKYRQTERGHALKLANEARARIKHREKRLAYSKKRHLLRLYGITQEDFNKRLRDQDFRCPICLRHRDEVGREFAVDHDHTSGTIRGLLCIRCNGIILRVVEKEWIKVERALEYLKVGSNWGIK